MTLAASIALAAPAIGQLRSDGAASENALRRRAARSEIEADKVAYVSRILGRITEPLPDGGAELADMLLSLPPSKLLAVSAATTRQELLSAVFGDVPANLGDEDTDLVFTPVVPCRLFDTRVTSNPFSNGETITFGVNGTPGAAGDMTAQGGDASDCGVPTDPAAVMVTLTAVNATSRGNMVAFAYNDPLPLASSVNFFVISGAIANTTIIPVCIACGVGTDIDVRAALIGANTVHLVGDVVGYFMFPANVGCLVGESIFDGKCVEDTARAAAASVFLASDDCHSDGGRLPDLLELRALRDETDITLADEYTDSVHIDDGATNVMIVSDAGGVSSVLATVSHQYRCVFEQIQ